MLHFNFLSAHFERCETSNKNYKSDNLLCLLSTPKLQEKGTEVVLSYTLSFRIAELARVW